MIKKILLFLCLLLSVSAFSQRVQRAGKIYMSESMILKGFQIEQFSSDDTFGSPSNTELPTSLAVKTYVDINDSKFRGFINLEVDLDTISSPVSGDIAYDSTGQKLYIRTADLWQNIDVGGGGTESDNLTTVIQNDTVSVDTVYVATKYDIDTLNSKVKVYVAETQNDLTDPNLGLVFNTSDSTLRIKDHALDDDALVPIQKQRIVATVADLDSVKASINSRVLVEQNGIDYELVDTVEFYTADDSLVIDMGNGTFFAADLSSKNKFRNIEDFKKQAPLLKLDGSTREFIISDIPVLVSATPLPPNSNKFAYADTIVDGYFLDTVSVAIQGDNYIRYSHLGPNSGAVSENAAINNTFYRPHAALGPEGKKTGTKLVSGNTFIYVNRTVPAGSVVLSFWAKTTQGLTGNEFRFDGVEYPIDEPTVWKKYIASGTSTGWVNFSLRPLLTAGDTLIIDNIQLETGSTVTSHKETYFVAPKRDKMYINWGRSIINDDKLELYRLDAPGTAVSTQAFDGRQWIQSAINYCNYGERCSEVLLSGVHVIDSTLILGQGVQLKGYTEAKFKETDEDEFLGGVVLRVDEWIYPNAPVIEIKPRNGVDNLNGGGMSNVEIYLTDTVGTVIALEESSWANFENIFINKFSTLGAFDIGLDITTVGASDQYFNRFYNIQIGAADSIGIRYEGSSANVFERVNVTNSKTGIRLVGGNHSKWINVLAQSNDTAILIDAGNHHFDDLYTEDSGQGIGGSVIVQRGGTLNINESTLQLSDALTDTLFNLFSGNLNVSNTSIRTSGAIQITPDFDFAIFENCSFIDDPRLKIIGLDRQLILKHCFNHNTGDSFVSNDLDHELKSNYQIDNILSNNVFIDTLFSSDPIVKLDVQNLLAYSDTTGSQNGANLSAGTDDAYVRHKTFTAPDGTLTASTISFEGDDIGGSSRGAGSITHVDTFDIGDDFVMSYWVYSFTGKEFIAPFVFRPYNDADNDTDFESLKIPPNKWVRVYVSGKIIDNTGPNLMAFRLRQPLSNVTLADSIAVWRFNLHKGRFPRSSIQTTGTPIFNQDVQTNKVFTTDGNGKIDFKSYNSLSDSLSVAIINDGDGTASTSEAFTEIDFQRSNLGNIGRIVTDTVIFMGSISVDTVLDLTGRYLKYSIDAALAFNLEGLGGLAVGEQVIIFNEGTANITIKADDAGAPAGKKFYAGSDYVLLPGRAVTIYKENINGDFNFVQGG